MRFIGRLIRRLLFLGVLVGIGSAAFKFFRDPMRRRQAQDFASTAASTAGQAAARAGRDGSRGQSDAVSPNRTTRAHRKNPRSARRPRPPLSHAAARISALFRWERGAISRRTDVTLSEAKNRAPPSHSEERRAIQMSF